MRFDRIALLVALSASAAVAQELSCDLSGYHAQDGLKAQVRSGGLELTWDGERHEELRARFAIG